jgi:hypothetical protein
MPDLLVTSDPFGRYITQVDGLAHPVLLAQYAEGLDRVGSHGKAMLARAALVADGRCPYCGRRLSSARTFPFDIGRSCR